MTKIALPSAAAGRGVGFARLIAVLALLFVFLLGVKGLGDGFKLLGGGVLDSFFGATRNPFVGLAIGILATTLVQSSSVTTSMIVGLVASPEHPLPIENAVPMVMGANIGTTVTNTIVSLAHIGRPDEFRRAFAVATCHDFFNFITVLVLLPLEMATGVLQESAGRLADVLQGIGGAKFDSPLRGAISGGLKPIKETLAAWIDSEQGQGAAMIALSGIFIFASLLLLVRVMRATMQHRVETSVTQVLGRHPMLAILVGMIVTVTVQSSSITTSLLVPLGAAGVITLGQAFPVTVGANVGTTVTGLLASTGVSGVNAAAGLHIALVHFLFNLGGVLLIFPFARIRQLPLRAAEKFAAFAVRSRRWALAYVAIIFYLLPAVLAVLHNALAE